MGSDVIPFLDLATVHRELKQELVAVFETSLATAGFIGGSMVLEFEREFAEFCESRSLSAWPMAPTRCASP